MQSIASSGFVATRQEVWEDGTVILFGPSPFLYLDRKVELPTGRQAQNAPVRMVQLGNLRSTQREITNVGLTKPRDDSYGLPLVVLSNGCEYIQDGHHRLSQSYFAGKLEDAVRYVDLDN